MLATHTISDINYQRIYMAVAISIAMHVMLVVAYTYKSNDILYVENGMRAFDKPAISLSFKKLVERTPIAPVIEKVKPVPAKEPITQTEPKTEIVEQQKTIPFIENPTYAGKRNPPVYPKRALMLKQEGEVMLKALVDVAGNVTEVDIISSSGFKVLDKSAVDAVWQWKFEPASVDGHPSISWVKVPVEFVII